MTTLKARFDGHVLIPEQPVELPLNEVLEIHVEDSERIPSSDAPKKERALTPLLELVEALEGLPHDPNSPTDGAAQHDHYLYGTPKRP